MFLTHLVLFKFLKGASSGAAAAATLGGWIPPKTVNETRKRREYEERDAEKKAFEQVVEAAYRGLFEDADALDADDKDAVRAAVGPSSRSRAKIKLPAPQTINYAALARDAEAVSRLIAIHDRLMADDIMIALLLAA
jgi:hypothetical protein